MRGPQVAGPTASGSALFRVNTLPQEDISRDIVYITALIMFQCASFGSQRRRLCLARPADRSMAEPISTDSNLPGQLHAHQRSDSVSNYLVCIPGVQ
jgi:hypothetical protein